MIQKVSYYDIKKKTTNDLIRKLDKTGSTD